ncbi:hypothetical protein ACFPOE_05165 [Caenimonas terrae]|uniref:Gluconate 2-dehydrogenase subunit 3 family protein n=1 Tax=Caenimonas terrae TaxID=696074 RepID=A0ABW0NBH3_9BURK
MDKSDLPPTPGAPSEGASAPELLLDAALKSFSAHFDNAEPSPALTDIVMHQVQAMRQAHRGVLTPQMRNFLQLVAGSPRLQSSLNGTGTPSEFVGQIQRFAAEHGFALQRGEIYALLGRYTAANDGALSDEDLDGVSAAAIPVPFQFVHVPTGDNPGAFGAHGSLSWSFSFRPLKP